MDIDDDGGAEMTTSTASEFTFHKAVREDVRLLIGLSGGTGSGKTYSAMRLAKGLAGNKRFAVIDTENGRASMYADYFDFDVCELSAPFTSERYEAAILAASDAGYPVILVDSGSHEWEGVGGILEQQEQILDAMVARSRERGDSRKDYQLEDAHGQRSWAEAKGPHKKMMAKLLQLKAHVIFCLRAQDTIEMVKDPQTKKTIVRPKQSLIGYDGWIPICEKRFPFELTVSFMLTAAKPGIPLPIKLQEQHRPFFPLDKPITEEAGRLIGEWAKGGTPKVETQPAKPETKPPLQETKPGVFEPQGQEPEPTAADWFKRIEAAPNLDALSRIGELLKDSKIGDDDRKTAGDLYRARRKQLKDSPQPQDIPAAGAQGLGADTAPAQAAEEKPWI